MCVGLPFILEESKLTFLLNCRHENNILPMEILQRENICGCKNSINVINFKNVQKIFLNMFADTTDIAHADGGVLGEN